MNVPPCADQPHHDMKVSTLGVDYCTTCGWVSPLGSVPDAKSPFRRKTGAKRRGESSLKRRAKIPKLIARDGDRCHYCKRQLGDGARTIDEKHPRSKGGLCVLDNQVLACRPCNTAKGDTPYDEYLALVLTKSEGPVSRDAESRGMHTYTKQRLGPKTSA